METEKEKLEIAFAGEVVDAPCECHKGKFIAYVIYLHPNGPRIPVRSQLYDTLEKAIAEIDQFVISTARELLKDNAYPLETAFSIKKEFGADAVASEEKRFRSENTSLH